MVKQFPDTVVFKVASTSIVDYVPTTTWTDYSTLAEVQPASNNVKVAPGGTQMTHKFDVFVPLSADIDNIKLATKVMIDSVEYQVIQSYSTKTIVSYEFWVGV